MSLYKGAWTKVNIGTHLPEEFEAIVVVQKGSVLSSLLFAVSVDVFTNKIKEGMLQEILYVDDVDSGEYGRTAGIILCRISALESKGLNTNLMKIKVMVSKFWQIIVKPSSKKDPCGICGRKTMLKAELCKSCGNCPRG